MLPSVRANEIGELLAKTYPHSEGRTTLMLALIDLRDDLANQENGHKDMWMVEHFFDYQTQKARHSAYAELYA